MWRKQCKSNCCDPNECLLSANLERYDLLVLPLSVTRFFVIVKRTACGYVRSRLSVCAKWLSGKGVRCFCDSKNTYTHTCICMYMYVGMCACSLNLERFPKPIDDALKRSHILQRYMVEFVLYHMYTYIYICKWLFKVSMYIHTICMVYIWR